MPSVKCSIYGLFIASIISLLVGIATLVLDIVFKYIGFVDDDIALSTCVDTYLMVKYQFLKLQLQASFVGVCVGVLMNIIVIGLVVFAIKNLRQFINQNPQQRQEVLSEQIMIKRKLSIIYVLIAFGTLGNVVCFGTYLSIYVEAHRDPSTCSFSYNDTNLLILVILSGAWLLTFIIKQIFVLMVRTKFAQDEVKEERRNKYKEMINVTEQPGVNRYENNQKPEEKNVLKYAQFTQQPSNGEVQSFGNHKQFNHKPIYGQSSKYPNSNTYGTTQAYLNETKDIDSSQVFKKSSDVGQSIGRFGGLGHQERRPETYKSYKERQIQQTYEQKKKQQANPKNIFEEVQHPHSYKVDVHSPAQKNGINAKPYAAYIMSQNNNQRSPYSKNSSQNSNQMERQNNSNEKNPSRIINSSNNRYDLSKYLREQAEQGNGPKGRSNVKGQSFSPIKILNEPTGNQANNHGVLKYSNSPIDRSPQNNRFTKSPGQQQRTLNNSAGKKAYRPQESFRGQQDEQTNGQLVFYKKPYENSHKQNVRQLDQRPELLKDDTVRYDKINSSGQVSFKSPSRFDTKFAQEQRSYLSKNTQNSILPMNNQIKESHGSRKNIVDDKYSSGGMHNSYFGAQSRGQESVPSPTNGRSRTKTREGVLTSFIRGKFV